MFKFFIQDMPFFERKIYLDKNPYTTKKNCQFCKMEIDDFDLILHKTKYWVIVYNKYPYYWEKENLLVFPIKHSAFTYELKRKEFEDYKNVEIFMKNYFWEENYFSFIRQWTWWRSVEHIHYHYLKGIFVNKSWKEFEVI